MKFKSISGSLAVTDEGDMVHLTYGYDRNGKPFCRTQPVTINPPEEKAEERAVARRSHTVMGEMFDSLFNTPLYSFHSFW